jgi:hypothetical protein
MTNPNDPKVTRALDAYIGYFLTEAPELKADMVQDSKLREAMARALDAADKPLPVRSRRCGVPGCTQPPGHYAGHYTKPGERSGVRGQQIQRVWIDEVPTQLVGDAARETVERILNAWEASVSGPADGPAPDGKEWVSSVSRGTGGSGFVSQSDFVNDAVSRGTLVSRGTPSLFDRLRGWRRRAR